MKNCTIWAALLFLVAQTVEADESHRPSEDELRAAKVARAGGIIEKPDAAKGKVVFFDCQKDEGLRLSRNEIAKALSALGVAVKKFRIEVVKVEPGDILGLMAKHNASVGIVITSKDSGPALLAAPEERWSEVNVAALARGLRTPEALERFWTSRCRKEVLRGLALACGALGSSFPGNIMVVTKTEDLDLCNEFMPVDTGEAIKKRLRDMGLTPRHFATYRAACKAGWAPAPTNDVQKAIWNEVHEMPSAPIKIKPETKKVSD